MSNEVAESKVTTKVVEALQGFLGDVPPTSEPTSHYPEQRAREIAAAASVQAAVVSGTLAMPPGPLGLLTIIPDLVAVWKIQAQMVSDIAGAYGKTGNLSKEQMLYCLFKHILAQSMRDIVVRFGERLIVKSTTLQVFQKALQKIGVKLTQRLVGKGVARWVPIVGALGVAAYAYYDTGVVSKNAIEFFSSL
ncbi:MAG: hypothetical protein WBP13_01505 [Methylophilaceae bacterium]